MLQTLYVTCSWEYWQTHFHCHDSKIRIFFFFLFESNFPNAEWHGLCHPQNLVITYSRSQIHLITFSICCGSIKYSSRQFFFWFLLFDADSMVQHRCNYSNLVTNRATNNTRAHIQKKNNIIVGYNWICLSAAFYWRISHQRGVCCAHTQHTVDWIGIDSARHIHTKKKKRKNCEPACLPYRVFCLFSTKQITLNAMANANKREILLFFWACYQSVGY